LDDVLDAGPDVVFVGTFDLSQRLGVPGQVEHPAVADALADIAARASGRGIAVGTWAPNAKVARRWATAGVKLVTVSNSAYLFGDACRALVTALHADPE